MNRNIRNNQNPASIYPQPYIDPMVYLNPYYSNQTEYEYNQQGYVDYSQFNDNTIDENYTLEEGLEYTNIPPEDDFNIPYIPYYPPTNMPQMLLPNSNYQALPNSMNIPNNQNMNTMPNNPNMNPMANNPNMNNMLVNPNMYYQQPKPMYPINMYPNMYPPGANQFMYPNMMPNFIPYWAINPDMSNINMEEFDEEEM